MALWEPGPTPARVRRVFARNRQHIHMPNCGRGMQSAAWWQRRILEKQTAPGKRSTAAPAHNGKGTVLRSTPAAGRARAHLRNHCASWHPPAPPMGSAEPAMASAEPPMESAEPHMGTEAAWLPHQRSGPMSWRPRRLQTRRRGETQGRQHPAKRAMAALAAPHAGNAPAAPPSGARQRRRNCQGLLGSGHRRLRKRSLALGWSRRPGP